MDNISENFLLQPENGISIKSWYTDEYDTALMQLAPLLMQIVKQQVPDVRQALRESKEKLMKMIMDGENTSEQLNKLSFENLSEESKPDSYFGEI